jgi:malate synthase
METEMEKASSTRLLVSGAIETGYESILTDQALGFLQELVERFGDRREALLNKRILRQGELDSGKFPDFLAETVSVRESDWTVRPAPQDLQDRRVEITGPVDRKMVINALNSGAKVFMADFEDANSPTWENTIEGQINLRDALDRTIEFTATTGKRYALKDEIATLLVRPRGWHLLEKHILFQGKPISASFVDFGLYLFHNGKRSIKAGTGPYFYLPKLENHLEARLWSDVIAYSEESLGLPKGSTRVTVLIETIMAAFEMDEILFELKDYIVGLNCGRWDYIFSFIKRFQNHPEFLLPDRAEVTMGTHFLRSYSQLLIKTCHRRGAHAMGGMAAQIPIKGDSKANEEAMNRVREDKEREAGDGHDGTWVAHPGLVPIAMSIFDEKMPEPNQLNCLREDLEVTATDLLQKTSGKITESGLRGNIAAAIHYMESWLRGQGCVALRNLMEDAATAEIARAQVWQWLHFHGITLEDGRAINPELVNSFIKDELNEVERSLGEQDFEKRKFLKAAELFQGIVMRDDFVEFLTLEAYEILS